jgi:hypothetical protein
MADASTDARDDETASHFVVEEDGAAAGLLSRSDWSPYIDSH